MSKKLDSVQARAQTASAAAVAAREQVAAQTDTKARKKVLAFAQKREAQAHQAQQRAKLLSKIENNEISKNEARRIKATKLRHQSYDFLKFFNTIGREKNPCTVEDTKIEHNGNTLRNKGRVFLGGTKPMYEYEDLGNSGKTWLCKEAVTCIGTAKPAGACVSAAAYALQKLVDPESAIETFVQKAPNGQVLGSFQERVEVNNTIDLFKWQADPKAPLPPHLTQQIMREHVTDWLLCNFDTKGENFVVDTNGSLRGIDKEQAFRFLNNPKAQTMSHDYSPNPNETLYDTMFKKFANGTMDLDLQSTSQYIQRVETMDNKEYLELFGDAIHVTCKDNVKRQSEMEDRLLQRKEGLRAQYKTFYATMIHERYKDNAMDYLEPDGSFKFQDEKERAYAKVEKTAEKAEEIKPDAPDRQAEQTMEKNAPTKSDYNMALDKTLALSRNISLFPLGEGLEQEFPSLNPMGAHSRMDLAFTQRMAEVQARVPLCTDAVQMEVTRLEATPTIVQARKDMAVESIQFGLIEHATVHDLNKLPEKQRDVAIHSVEALANTVKGAPSVRLCDAHLCQLESLTGIQKEPLSQTQTALLKDANLMASDEAMKQSGQRGPRPALLHVPFQNSENWAWRSSLLESAEKGPQALTDNLKSFHEHNAEKAGLNYDEKQLQTYADATVKRALDPLFEGMKEKQPYLDNKDLIFINGKSLNQHLNEQKVGPEDRDRESRLILASALQTNKSIRAYLPNPATGEPSREPTQLTQEGYTPSPLNKPHLNAWERFWSKRNFYKEKTAQLHAYKDDKHQQKAEVMAVENTTQKAHRTSDCTKITEEPLQCRKNFQDSLNTTPINDGTVFRTHRSTATFAACVLLRDHSIEDILDPNKLQAEKIAAGKEVAELRGRDSPEEFAKLTVPAAQKLVNRPDPAMDFTKLSSYAKNPIEITASQILFELNQEMAHNATACKDYCIKQTNSPEAGNAQYALLDTQSSNRGNYFTPVLQGAKAFADNSKYDPKLVLSDHLSLVAGMDLFLNYQGENHTHLSQTPIKASSGISSFMAEDPPFFKNAASKNAVAGLIMKGDGGALFDLDINTPKERATPDITRSALHKKLAEPEKAPQSMTNHKAAGKTR